MTESVGQNSVCEERKQQLLNVCQKGKSETEVNQQKPYEKMQSEQNLSAVNKLVSRVLSQKTEAEKV